MLVPPRLKLGDSIRLDGATYAVAGSTLFDCPTFRWYEWPAYDAISARWVLLAQVGGALHLAAREIVSVALPPVEADLGPEHPFAEKTEGSIRLEATTSEGTTFDRGRYWHFASPDGAIAIFTEMSGQIGRLTASPLDPARYELYPA